MSWAQQYIGVPWEAGAQGPHAFDCMGFFRCIQSRHFGIELPAIVAPDYDDPTRLVSFFGRHQEHFNWQQIDVPVQGCAVIVRKPLHVGVWLEIDGGGVMHCVRGVGVIFTSDSAWPNSGFGKKEYFNHITCPHKSPI